MNHDSVSSSAVSLPPTQDGIHDTRAGSRESGRQSGPSRERSQSPTRKNKAIRLRKLRLVTELMSNLDMVVFAELCALYYMDCSFFRLFIRATAQSLFLSPKSEDILILMPAHRPHVFAVFVPNIICILLHIFLSLPEANEAARGYLHGGVMVDFIGQKAPTSKFSLLLLDVAVLAIQCFMLAVHKERDRLRQAVPPARRSNSVNMGGDNTSAAVAPTIQDHDAEERGVLRDEPTIINDFDDIEMRPLRNRRDRTAHETGETNRLISGASSQDGAVTDPVDVLSSGNAILTDFHVVAAIRSLGNDYQSAAAHSLQTLGFAWARLATEQRTTLGARGRS